jgi:uncharacterized iron-regulated protein
MGNDFSNYVAGEKMTLEELINAIERLQAVYDLMVEEDQREAKQYVRWAIKHLADKTYMAAL